MNNIPKYQGGGYLERLMGANIGDIQSSAATKLAKSMRGFGKKEKWLRTISGLGKGIFKFIDPTGGILGAGVDVALDPILRAAGLGGKKGDIKLDKEYQIFGGKKGLETAQEGAADALSDYRQSSLINALLGFGGSKAGEAFSDKFSSGLKGVFGDIKKHGNISDALARQTGIGGDAYAKKVTEATGRGGALYEDYLDKFFGGDVYGRSSSPGQSTLSFTGQDFDVTPDMLSKTIPQTGGMYSALQTQAPMQGVTALKALTQEQDNQWLDRAIDKQVDTGTDPTTLWLQSLMNPEGTYEQGGMVQKYENGGQVAKTTGRKLVSDNPGDPSSSKSWVTTWDTYEYDGLNWNKTQSQLEEDPGAEYTTMTQAQMDSYRDPTRTETVGSSYMETTSEVGLNEFLRTPAVAQQVQQARAGSPGAMENLIEILRQQRPEMADKTNEELRTSLGKILPNIDLYGEGYQETLAGGATTLEGLVGEAQTMRGQAASGAATSGIRTGSGGFRGGDTISEALYTGAENVYAGMQKDIQTGFEEEFKPLEAMFVNPSLGA